MSLLKTLPTELKSIINENTLEMNEEQLKSIMEEIMEDTDFYYYGKNKIKMSFLEGKLECDRYGATEIREVFYNLFVNYGYYNEAENDIEYYGEYMEDTTEEELKELYLYSKKCYDFLNNLMKNTYGLTDNETELLTELFSDY